jgi:hypothetical protein
MDTNIKEKQKNCLKQSVNDEIFVMELLKNVFGGTCHKGNFKEDTNDHIDIWWDSPKKGLIPIDVKGRKKDKQKDENYNDTIQWIELVNVKGEKGWLYGKSEYISFITKNKVIFVKTNKLQEYSEKMIEGKDIVYTTPKDFYIPYQRKNWGRKDVIFKCPIKDLIEINDFIIKFDVLE